jgi:hypothetical protein
MPSSPSSTSSSSAAGRTAAAIVAAIAGAALLASGLIVEIARADSSGSAVELTDAGVLLALFGAVVLALGLVGALALLTLPAAATPAVAITRIAGIVAVSTIMAAVIVAAATYLASSDLRISDAGSLAAASRPANAPATTPTAPAGGAGRIAIAGRVTLDGVPFDARFIGAAVLRDGMKAACQQDIAQVAGGQYDLRILTDADVAGCGAPGAHIVLWAAVGPAADVFVWSNELLPWPDSTTASGPLAFDATFSTVERDGAGIATTDFFGLVRDAAGAPVAGGTPIEARVNGTLCGRGTVRREGFDGYNLSVSSSTVPGCDTGAPITFRVGGRAARESAANDLNAGGNGHNLDLTVD